MVNQGTLGYTSTPLSVNLSSSIHTMSSDFGPHHKQAYTLKLIPTKMGANPTQLLERPQISVWKPLSHSCLMEAVLIGMKQQRAAWRGRSMSLQILREMRVRGVVIRQKAARVFMTGRGLPGWMDRPWAVARCRARCVFSLNSCFWRDLCVSACVWRDLCMNSCPPMAVSMKCLLVKRSWHEFMSTNKCEHETSPCEEIFAWIAKSKLLVCEEILALIPVHEWVEHKICLWRALCMNSYPWTMVAGVKFLYVKRSQHKLLPTTGSLCKIPLWKRDLCTNFCP